MGWKDTSTERRHYTENTILVDWMSMAHSLLSLCHRQNKSIILYMFFLCISFLFWQNKIHKETLKTFLFVFFFLLFHGLCVT